MASLQFKLEGRESDRADFADFSYFTEHLRNCLKRVHRVKNPGSGPLPKFGIADLEVGSAMVTLDGDPECVADLTTAIERLKNRQLPDAFTYEDIKAFRKLARPLEHSTSTITVQRIPIDIEFVSGCDELLESATEAIGDAIGALDGLNVHRHNFFRLYPEGQDVGVECTFDPALFDDVQAALKKRVVVRGNIVRDPNGVTIARINHVQSISVLPDPDELPPISDLFGLFKDTPIDLEAASNQWS